MRILTVCGNLELGGTQRVAQTFTLAYQRAGHEVAVLASETGGIREQKLQAHGVPTFVANGDLGHVHRFATEFQPDLVHIHRPGIGRRSDTELLGRLADPKRKIIETNIFGRPDYTEGERLIDVHLLLSSWCMWKWRKSLGRRMHEQAGVIVPNPVEPRDFERAGDPEIKAFRAELGIPEGAYLCGRLGQASYGKWHPQNLLAFLAVARRDPGAHMILGGLPDSLRPVLESFPVDVRSRVRLLEVTDSDQELSLRYSAMDCFLHAAQIGESFGLVLTEAMLCGCPIVTAARPARDNSQVEVVGHREGGLVAGSVKALPDAAVALWEDRALRERIGRTGRAWVLERYGADRVAGLAVRVGEIALASKNRDDLIAQLAKQSDLRTHTSDAAVSRLLSGLVGRPRGSELVGMRVANVPIVQRTLQAVNRWRLGL